MNDMHIEISRDSLTKESAAECATFGQLEISVGGRLLTGLLEHNEKMFKLQYSKGPFVPGYHLAEWFATHWWRLRWEPNSKAMDYASHGSHLDNSTYSWNLSHRMSDIGEGYIWPNIIFNCDGYLCEVTSHKSTDRFAPIEYLGSDPTYLKASNWEAAVDVFVTHVMSLLDATNLHDTDLYVAWQELGQERNDEDLTRYRRIEALLGFDVDEGNEEYINAIIKDANDLGFDAVAELATGAGNVQTSASDIRDMSEKLGGVVNVEDSIPLSPGDFPDVSGWGHDVAWRIGKLFAQSVRHKANLPDGPVSDQTLTSLVGASASVIDPYDNSVPFSWIYGLNDMQARVVLRSGVPANRRFNMARIIGDWVFGIAQCVSTEPLSPATMSYSYRQKAQRSFAAELLCPWHAIKEYFERGYDHEDIEQVATLFKVSKMVVGNVLENNSNLDRQLLTVV